MKRLFITVPLIIILAILSVYVTTVGWDKLIVYFHGSSIGLWKTFLLSFAFSILRANPMQLNKELEPDKKDYQLLGITISSLALDSLVVYLLLPYILS